MKIPKNADKFVSRIALIEARRGKHRIEIPRNADKIIDREWKKFQLKAVKLLEDKNYAKDIERWKKAGYIGNEADKIAKAISNKYSITMPYPLDYLKAVKDAKQPLRTADGRIDLPEGGHIVKIINADMRRNDATGRYEIEIDEGKGVQEGYFYFRIKCNVPRALIHFSLDHYLIRMNMNKPRKRFREEQIEALKIWEERRLRKPFRQIASELNIREPAAKKQFYKAHEIIFGKKYNPADYEKPEIKKEYLKRECNTCKERPTCKDQCPDVIEFVEQDSKGYLREKALTQKRHDMTHFGERMDTD